MEASRKEVNTKAADIQSKTGVIEKLEQRLAEANVEIDRLVKSGANQEVNQISLQYYAPNIYIGWHRLPLAYRLLLTGS